MAQKLVKCFDFGSRNIRDRLTFSDDTKIRLNPETQPIGVKGAEHRALVKQKYTTRWMRISMCESRQQIQESLIRLLGFGATPRPTLQPANTTVAYKLNDGTDDYYWDGRSMVNRWTW